MSKPITPPMSTPQDAPVAPGSIEELERQLKFIQLQRLAREEQEYAELQESKRKARESGIESIRMQMRHAEINQSHCGHLKENGRTNLAGQKDHSGVQHLICQRCQKHFLGSEVPPHLVPSMEIVGGPH